MASKSEHYDFETEIHAVVALALKAIGLAQAEAALNERLLMKDETIDTLHGTIRQLEKQLEKAMTGKIDT